MVLGTNIKQVTACFQISAFEEKLLKNALKTSCSGIHSFSEDGIKCLNRKECTISRQLYCESKGTDNTVHGLILPSHSASSCKYKNRVSKREGS